MTAPEAAAVISTANLMQGMAGTTQAMRRALGGLAPGSRLELETVLAAFRGVHRVSEMRHALKTKRHDSSSAEYVRCEAEYQGALRDWDRHLPRLHGWLLAERSRLRSRSGHAHLVRAWVDADRQTR